MLWLLSLLSLNPSLLVAISAERRTCINPRTCEESSWNFQSDLSPIHSFKEELSKDGTEKQFGPNEVWHWLTSRGRSRVRKLIDEEKARRFEVKTRWVTRLILPLLAAIVGIIGAPLAVNAENSRAKVQNVGGDSSAGSLSVPEA